MAVEKEKGEEMDLEGALQRYFSFPRYRPGQRQVVQAALEGRDCSVLWATGTGEGERHRERGERRVVCYDLFLCDVM